MKRWNEPKILFQLLFQDDKTFTQLFCSLSPHLINTPAGAQEMWILHVKSNFKETKIAQKLIIHHKVPKNAQENSQSLKTICLSPRCWQKHLPHLCSSLDAILYTVNYMEISPVSNREGLRLCTARSGCCFAQHGQSYNAGWELREITQPDGSTLALHEMGLAAKYVR